MTEIELVPLALADSEFLGRLCEDVSQVFHTPVHDVTLPVNLDTAMDVSRQQYHSGQILVELLKHARAGDSKILGVTTRDLFLPVLTFVFGQAQVQNRAAVYSTYRLRNEFYGLPEDPELLYQRAIKEALHELGHTFGLRHCTMHPCVMNSSTYVEDIDLKPVEFCEPCWSAVESDTPAG